MEEHSGTSSVADSAVGSKQLTFTLKKVNTHKVENICFSLVFQILNIIQNSVTMFVCLDLKC